MNELPKTKLPSEFRVWLTEKWMEHKDELMLWEKRQPEYDDKYYFRKHKWMLRKMYREEFIRDNHRKLQKEVKRGFKKGNL